jgi:hypothetical protein
MLEVKLPRARRDWVRPIQSTEGSAFRRRLIEASETKGRRCVCVCNNSRSRDTLRAETMVKTQFSRKKGPKCTVYHCATAILKQAADFLSAFRLH